jgi:hypothetical protein
MKSGFPYFATHIFAIQKTHRSYGKLVGRGSNIWRQKIRNSGRLDGKKMNGKKMKSGFPYFATHIFAIQKTHRSFRHPCGNVRAIGVTPSRGRNNITPSLE